MKQRGVLFVDHYIDDFITLGRPSTNECKRNQPLILESCKTMGVPIEAEKLEGPSSSLVFLGIEHDSIAMEMRLPFDKISNIRDALAKWHGKKAGRKWGILFLIGSLSHAAKPPKWSNWWKETNGKRQAEQDKQMQNIETHKDRSTQKH